MPHSVAGYCKAKFGSAKAQPPIIGVYTGKAGWESLKEARLRLTPETARNLRAEGCTMLRVRWRFQNIDVVIRHYLGE